MPRTQKEASYHFTMMEITTFTKAKLFIYLTFVVLNGGLITAALFTPIFYYLFILSFTTAVRTFSIIALFLDYGRKSLEGCFTASTRRTPELNEEKGSERHVLMVIPCYTETKTEIQRTVDSVVNQKKTFPCRVVLGIVVDGEVVGKGNAVPTSKLVQELLGFDDNLIQTYDYVSWKGLSMSIRVVHGIYQSIPYVVLMKSQNQGKKDSLILIRSLIQNYNLRLEKLYEANVLSSWFEDALSRSGVNHIDYVVGTDADSVFAENVISTFVERMSTETDVLGVSSVVQPDLSVQRGWNPLIAYQFFEYIYGQLLTRECQGLFGQVTCLPGAGQILTTDPNLTKDPLKKFSDFSGEKKTAYHLVRALLGEDRRWTCLLLYKNPGYRTLIDSSCIVYTAVPDNMSVFFSQRRRWFLSAQANNIRDLLAPNVRLPIRIIAFSQILSSYISPFILFVNIRLFMYLFVDQYAWIWVASIMGILGLFKIYVILFYPKTFYEAFTLLYGVILHFVCSSLLQLAVALYAIWNMDDMRWGLTRQIEEEEEDKNAEMEFL
ncbi:chitin synthase-domain-containing protein [Paraphysoderma sedebokerense]|nr:chitin synthase-domain-containing protein [Paraphysoderma sedebokerense]